MFTAVPARIDLAGGWLDVPRLAWPGAFIVNCAISPMITLDASPYHYGGGIGGSGAKAVLSNPETAVDTELDAGVGWQDPAIILETGICAWASGPRPKLVYKMAGDMLQGRMALLWTGVPHSTPALAANMRPYGLIADAAGVAQRAILQGSFNDLVAAVVMSYRAQLTEGMDEVVRPKGATASKYCGSGWGGYVLHIFPDAVHRDEYVANTPEAMAIEPYIRNFG